MLFLLLSIATLALGPVLYRIAARRPASVGALDSFVFVTLSGLVLLHLIPHALDVGGSGAVVAVLLGLAGPALAERLLRRAAAGVHLLFLSAALLGLAGHAFLDGLALIGSGSSSPLAVAVILHRLPDGLAIWWLLRVPYGAGVAASTLGLMASATVAGFFVGDVILFNTNQSWLASLQAFVAASLVHVVLHRPHAEKPGPSKRSPAELVGALVGAGLLAGLFLHRHEEHGSILLTGLGLVLFGLACLLRYGRWGWTEKLIGHHEHGGHPGREAQAPETEPEHGHGHDHDHDDKPRPSG